MYSFHFDEDIAVLIGNYRGSSDSDDDWARCLTSLEDAEKGSVRRALPLVCIIVVAPESPQLPAIWRKRMADWQSSARSRELYFALVAPNALVRGVFTAINWMTKFRSPRHVMAAASTFTEAAAWVREVTARPYPSLEALYQEARSPPASGARIAVPTRSVS